MAQFTYGSDVKICDSEYWQLLKTSSARNSDPLVPCLFGAHRPRTRTYAHVRGRPFS